MPVCRILSRKGEELRRFATESRALGAQISVGRSSSCTIPLKHDAGRTVSREHFVLEQRPQGWILINRSSHGTLKGDRNVEQSEVQPGDVFQFGSCFFCFGDGAEPTRYQLRWEDPESGEDYAVLWPGRNLVGAASSNTIAIKLDSVSRQHARLTVSDDKVYLEDLNSSLGTFVSGKRITALTALTPNLPVRFGKVNAWLAVSDQEAPGAVLGPSPAAAGGSYLWMAIAVAVTIVIVLTAIVLNICF